MRSWYIIVFTGVSISTVPRIHINYVVNAVFFQAYKVPPEICPVQVIEMDGKELTERIWTYRGASSEDDIRSFATSGINLCPVPNTLAITAVNA